MQPLNEHLQNFTFLEALGKSDSKIPAKISVIFFWLAGQFL